MAKHITRNRRNTQRIFDDGDTLMEMNYQNLSERTQKKIRENLEIASPVVASDLIKIAKRFPDDGDIRKIMIKKHLYMDTLALMASETFTDKQVIQMLNLIHFPASNSNKCASSSRECQAIFYQVRDGIPANQKAHQDPVKKTQTKQEIFDDWNIDLDESLDIEEKSPLKDQIERKVQDTYMTTKYAENRQNPRLDELKEYRQFLQTALNQITEAIKDIKYIEDIELRKSQQVEETQKKIQSNGHIKQTT